MSKNVSKSAEDIDDTQKRFLDRLVQRWNFRIDLHVLCLILSGLILIIFSLIGFTWGMPARWEPDSITKEVIYLYDAHTLEPQSYKYGTFYLYTMLFLSKPFVSDPGAVTAFFYVPRILNILLGLGILIMVMQIGNRYRPIVGSLSTLLLSMTMGFINYIHFEVLDIPMLFFLVLCFLLLLRQKIWWAAVAFGFAVATKQIAILILPSIAAFTFVEHLSNKPWKTMLQRTAIFGSAGVVLFFVTSPYYLLNLSKVWALREYTKTTWFLSYRGLEGNIGWITHPYNLWNMLGPALFFTAILGIWLAWRERSILDREVLALLLPYLVLQLFFRMTPMRYLLPLAPLLI
ncbi:MAG TPA: glycosyltransferase 87 family protein, partial [Candidatus Nanoarchaeia archaeon]|nr:glycosyltransferase 87 family protein [Candidatus Nanoarchaeia archaeon]